MLEGARPGLPKSIEARVRGEELWVVVPVLGRRVLAHGCDLDHRHRCARARGGMAGRLSMVIKIPQTMARIMGMNQTERRRLLVDGNNLMGAAAGGWWR